MYKITLGHEGSADCTLKINDKEYAIESDAWNLLSIIRDGIDKNTQSNRTFQSLLEYIYTNFDSDLTFKRRTTDKEQPKEEICHCGSTIPQEGCGSMWCPSDPSN